MRVLRHVTNFLKDLRRLRVDRTIHPQRVAVPPGGVQARQAAVRRGPEERRVHPPLSGHEGLRLQQEAQRLLPAHRRLAGVSLPGAVSLGLPPFVRVLYIILNAPH